MDPYGLSPEEQQQIMAAALRGQSALSAAAQRGGRFDNMAAIAQLANNPAAAKAAQVAQAQALAANKPAQMGSQGFMIPSTGEFLASPMFMQDKMEGRAQQRGLQQDRLLQAAQLAQDRLAQQQALQSMMEQGRNDRAAQSNALRQTLATMMEAGRNDRAQAAADAKAAKGAGGKQLPWAAVKELSSKSDAADTYAGFVSTFKPEYSGVTGSSGLSNAQNMFGRMAPGLIASKSIQDQASWWQNYNAQANLLRKELFGSALTATEKAAFDAANIEPGMNPTMIERRLADQAKAAKNASRKLVQNAGKGGYDVSGFDVGDEEAPAPAPTAPATTPRRLKFNPATGALE